MASLQRTLCVFPCLHDEGALPCPCSICSWQPRLTRSVEVGEPRMDRACVIPSNRGLPWDMGDAGRPFGFPLLVFESGRDNSSVVTNLEPLGQVEGHAVLPHPPIEKTPATPPSCEDWFLLVAWSCKTAVLLYYEALARALVSAA